MLGVSLLIGLHAAWTEDDDPVPPTRAEAEAVLDETVRYARSGAYTLLCEAIADADATCRNLVESARQSGWAPTQDRPEVVGVRRSGLSTVLELRGTRTDGSTFTSDFAVVRDHRGLRGSTPIYWSGVTIVS
ncbi:ATP synthase subunit B family protein [Saccharothrix variisporea]|uniref:Uncharacterized protein n=1 Tax=Saccharothrix variisporea TaxID=543527 RepID=A0A495XBJ9_9PSEU|nr:hypothetical protein [Saccharothrix variisporea]RKT69963.1 hypothetical protein DFJ66_3202 [Saccharothrix variisporea]